MTHPTEPPQMVWDIPPRIDADAPVTHQAVERAIWTIHQRLSEDLLVDDLAAAAHFSKFHFSRIFKRATGLSPRDYLSQVRYSTAVRLLLTTSKSVTEITHEVGYNSVGTFSSRFHRVYGHSPSEFRQLYVGRSPIEVAQRISSDKEATAALGSTCTAETAEAALGNAGAANATAARVAHSARPDNVYLLGS